MELTTKHFGRFFIPFLFSLLIWVNKISLVTLFVEINHFIMNDIFFFVQLRSFHNFIWANHNIGWLLRKHNYHLYQVSQFTNAWSGSPGAKNKHLFSAFIAFDDYSCLYIRSHYAKDIRVCSICPFSDDFLVWWHGTYFMDYIPYVVWLYVVRVLRISHYHFFAIDLISSADYIGILSTNYKR